MWDELLLEAGLNEREVRSIMILGSRPKMKASELAKELNTTRLDAYNSLSRLQEMGIVTATADRPMLFSSLRINEAMEHIIQSRKQQLDRLVEGFDELSKGITETDASYEKQRRDIDDPRFAVLKERSHIYNRLQKMANDAEERLILLLGQFGIPFGAHFGPFVVPKLAQEQSTCRFKVDGVYKYDVLRNRHKII